MSNLSYRIAALFGVSMLLMLLSPLAGDALTLQ